MFFYCFLEGGWVGFGVEEGSKASPKILGEKS